MNKMIALGMMVIVGLVGCNQSTKQVSNEEIKQAEKQVAAPKDGGKTFKAGTSVNDEEGDYKLVVTTDEDGWEKSFVGIDGSVISVQVPIDENDGDAVVEGQACQPGDRMVSQTDRICVKEDENTVSCCDYDCNYFCEQVTAGIQVYSYERSCNMTVGRNCEVTTRSSKDGGFQPL